MTPDPRVLVALSDLPGFHPIGLLVATWTGYHQNDERPSGYELLVGHSDSGHPVVVATDKQGRQLHLRHKIALDFSDTATRDRAARWLAGWAGLALECSAPTWVPSGGRGSWMLAAGRQYKLWGDLGGPADRPEGLRLLDRRNEARCPDGSHLVDALAMAVVARHVGGQP